LFVALFALGWLLGGRAESPDPDKPEAKPRLREPVALALVDDGKLLFAANQHSGTVSIIDTKDLRLVGEAEVGRRLADLAATADGRRLLAVDEEAGELVLLGRRGTTLEVLHRVAVAAAPVSVQVAADGKQCFVASLWSRRLAVVDLTADKPAVTHSVALPFPPRKQLFLGAGKLVVADAFGGRLAVVDVGRGQVVAVHTVPGHNIRDLARDPGGKNLLLTQQVLGGRTQTTSDEIHWGNLITNNVRLLPLEGLLDPKADVLRGSRLLHLGEVGRGAGDPSGLAVTADGSIVVALSGVDEIAFGPQEAADRHRLKVGRRPTAVTLAADARRAYVAETFADAVGVVDLRERKVQAELSLGAPPELSLAERGERLFHDARLSHEGWFSCQSCHTDGHTNGQLNDNLGDDSYGAPKRVLSLLGVKDTGPWAWNGKVPELAKQIRKSMLTTMRGPEPAAEQVEAIEAFLRTLPPAPPLHRPATPEEEAMVRRGREVFQRQDCARCHTPPTYTSAKAYSVGLVDEVGNTHFNPPSLRGVGQGGPYFHDNRAATLEEVFTRHSHQVQGKLSETELADLLAFLRSL
jgi:DNA-binding beta-propeller fold protein YncE